MAELGENFLACCHFGLHDVTWLPIDVFRKQKLLCVISGQPNDVIIPKWERMGNFIASYADVVLARINFVGTTNLWRELRIRGSKWKLE